MTGVEPPGESGVGETHLKHVSDCGRSWEGQAAALAVAGTVAPTLHLIAWAEAISELERIVKRTNFMAEARQQVT